MKLICIVYLFLSFNSFSQRRTLSIQEIIYKGDSLERLLENPADLNIVTDTLPGETSDELNAWREMKLFRYYFDNSRKVKKISYRNGSEGYYNFYFDDHDLRKVHIIKTAGLVNLCYYYSAEDNNGSGYDKTSERIDLLNMAKDFIRNFKTL
jgi:hypothetical protein